MRIPLLLLVPFLLLSGAALSAQRSPEPGAIPLLRTLVLDRWSMHAHWEDGLAEVALYRGERVVDGFPRPHELTVVTERERLHRELHVRAEPPHGDKPLLDALRQTTFATVPTREGTMHLHTALVVPRAQPADTIRLTVSTQQPRGATFDDVALHRNPPEQRYSSWREEVGSGTRTLGLHGPEAHFEEELPLLLRALPLDEGLHARLMLYPPQPPTRGGAPQPVAALVTVRAAEEGFSSGAGVFPADALWDVLVEADDGRLIRFAIAREFPHALVLFDHSDGRRYTLEALERRPSWSRATTETEEGER